MVWDIQTWARRVWMRRSPLIIAIALLAGSGIVLGAVRFGKRTPEVQTFDVKQGEFIDSLQLHGEIKARKTTTISAPADSGDLQVLKIIADGAAVRAGDTVVEFDSTKTQSDLAQYRSTVKSARAEIEQARAQGNIQEQEDQTAITSARYAVEIAKLEAMQQEILSQIEGEKKKLAVADAEQKLKEAEVKLKSDRTLNQATINKSREAEAKAAFDVQRAEHALEHMVLRAPSAGTVTLISNWNGNDDAPYKAGDHAWPGSTVAELPDATTMQITARVDESERGRMAPHKEVAIQLDSIPDRQFTGHIEQIGAIASIDFRGGWPFASNFPLVVAIDQTDPRLRPGMSAQLTVTLEKIPNALTIPRQALFQKSGQSVAYVWQGGQFEERAVNVGRRSGDRVLVAKGLRAGEKIAMKDPTVKE